MDVVDEPVYLGVVGKTYVKHFTVDSEGTFLCLRPRCENHVEVLQNLADADVDICVDAPDSNRAVHARQPTGNGNRELPRLALCNRWRRGFLRLELYRSCVQAANNCEHCSHERKEFCPHEPILCWSVPKSEKNLRLSIGLWGYSIGALDVRGLKKNRPPDERRPIDLTNLRNSPLV